MKPARIPPATEAQTQAAIVEWIRRVVRGVVFTVPNEGKRSVGAAMHLRGLGMARGAPDIVCAYMDSDGSPRVLFIECKSISGRLSEHQIRMRDDLKTLGHDWLLARSLDDVIAWFGDA